MTTDIRKNTNKKHYRKDWRYISQCTITHFCSCEPAVFFFFSQAAKQHDVALWRQADVVSLVLGCDWFVIKGNFWCVLTGIYVEFIRQKSTIDHFTVVCSVTWPLGDSEARVDLVLIQTSLPGQVTQQTTVKWSIVRCYCAVDKWLFQVNISRILLPCSWDPISSPTILTSGDWKTNKLQTGILQQFPRNLMLELKQRL